MDSIIANVNNGQDINVYWQDEVELQLDLNLMYIKSGQKEIEDYVENVSKPEISDYVETEAKPLVSRIVTEIAEPTVNEYLETTVKPEIDDYVEDKKPELQAFVTQAQGFANDAQEAADTATANVNSYVDGTVKPSLQTYVDQAQADANSAATSMEQAALSATSASNYASNASADADNAAESATHAATSATDSEHYSEDSRIWAEGTDSEVTALGGVHSSKVWSEIVEGAITTIEGAVGDIGFAPLGIDETQNKRRYLNGQVISQTQFASFADKVKAAVALYPSLSATEENWQAEVTNSKLGQCGKFVIDDTAGTIRLPKVVNINGLQDLSLMGGIKTESLPNITGDLKYSTYTESASGAMSKVSGQGKAAAIQFSEYGVGSVDFDASRVSSTYQDNAPVQQEAVQYPYFIQVATGSEESVDVSTEIQLNNPFFFGMHIWSDTAISNASWLISNGSYHSGATYASFYQWLLKIHNGTLTVDGVSVKAYGASDITDYDYVINTADTTFRLPVKVKLASGNAVAGNGMTLGLTDGTSNFGLEADDASALKGARGAYGQNAGTSATASDITNKMIGITTDPTKSGIETSSQGLKLYFYVGETIQDANVINAAGVLTRVANSIDRTVASDRETVVGWGMPDYSAGVGLSYTTTNTNFPASGIAYFGYRGATNTSAYIYIDDQQFGIGGSSAGNINTQTAYIVSKNNVYRYQTASAGQYGIFYPFKGVN